jgi:tRNA(Ser,Leu) C12 N-acetylase TAN1
VDWNTIAVPEHLRFREAWRALEAFGTVRKTPYLNVLALTATAPPRELMAALTEAVAADPDEADLLSRVAPAEATFTFQDVTDFDARAQEAALARLEALAGRAFHVRIHRRGFKRGFERLVRERHLGEALLRGLADRGAPGRISYEDPDAVVAIETVDTRAGLAVWSREELARWPLLRPG